MDTLRIIHQDPNVPRYSDRVPREAWEAQKPFLQTLHEDGLSRREMIQQLAVQRHFFVTKNRLDNKMNEWGFGRYKQHSRVSRVPPKRPDAVSPNPVGVKEPPQPPDIVQNEVPYPLHSDPVPLLSIWDEETSPDSSATGPTPNCQPAETGQHAFSPPISFQENGLFAYIPDVSTPSLSTPSTNTSNQNRPWSGLLDLSFYACLPETMALQERFAPNLQLGIIPSGGIHRLKRMGGLLHALKSFKHAFDIYFLVLQYYNVWDGSGDGITADLAIAILNCAQSAHTKQQRIVARYAIQVVWKIVNEIPWVSESVWDSKCYLIYVSEDSTSLNGLSDLLDQRRESLRSIINLLYTDDLKFTVLGWRETRDEILGLSDEPGHLQSCERIRSCLMNALETVMEHLQQSTLVDSFLESVWIYGIRNSHMQTARILSILLLHGRTQTSTRVEHSEMSQCGHYIVGFGCTFIEMALLISPYIITDHTLHMLMDHHSAAEAFVQGKLPKPSLRLREAIAQIQLSMKGGDDGYATYLRRYMESIVGDINKRRLEIDLISESWILDFASGMAGLRALPKLSLIEMLSPSDSKQPQNPNSITFDSARLSSEATDLSLASDVLRWSISDTSSMRSFRKFSNRIKVSMVSANARVDRSSDAMSLCSQDSSKASLFSGLSILSPRSSTRQSLLPPLEEEMLQSKESDMQNRSGGRAGGVAIRSISSPVLISTTNLHQVTEARWLNALV